MTFYTSKRITITIGAFEFSSGPGEVRALRAGYCSIGALLLAWGYGR